MVNPSRELTVYDLGSAHVLSSIRNIQFLACGSPAAYVHDGNAILVGCNDGQARLYDSRLSSCIQTLDHEGQWTRLLNNCSAETRSRTRRYHRIRCLWQFVPIIEALTQTSPKSHAFEDPDHFLIATASSRNSYYTVYLWDTVERGD